MESARLGISEIKSTLMKALESGKLESKKLATKDEDGWTYTNTATTAATEMAYKQQIEQMKLAQANALNAKYYTTSASALGQSGIANKYGAGILGLGNVFATDAVSTIATVAPKYYIPTAAVPASAGTVSAGVITTGMAAGYIPPTYIMDKASASQYLPKQSIKAGDLIVCKNDHPICVAMEDFEHSSNDQWIGKMGFWQQDPPSPQTLPENYECACCRASFTRVNYRVELDARTVEFITRPKAEEKAA